MYVFYIMHTCTCSKPSHEWGPEMLNWRTDRRYWNAPLIITVRPVQVCYNVCPVMEAIGLSAYVKTWAPLIGKSLLLNCPWFKNRSSTEGQQG